MNKTKLGINEYLFVTLIFVAAIMGPIPMLGLILYAAVAEKSEIITSGSKTAIFIKAGFVIVEGILNFIEYIVRTFASDAYDFYTGMSRVNYFLNAAFIVTMIVFVVINAIKGFSSNKPQAAVVNTLLANDAAPAQPQAPVQPAAPVAPAQPAAPAPAAAPAVTKCPKCGKELANGTTFCPACGTKVQG